MCKSLNTNLFPEIPKLRTRNRSSPNRSCFSEQHNRAKVHEIADLTPCPGPEIGVQKGFEGSEIPGFASCKAELD